MEEGTCFNSVLSFTVPHHRSLVTKYQDSRLRSSRGTVAAMACVNEAVCRHRVTSRLRHVPGNRFSGITIKVVPVIVLEHSLADVWMLRVERNLPLLIQFQRPEYPV